MKAETPRLNLRIRKVIVSSGDSLCLGHELYDTDTWEMTHNHISGLPETMVVDPFFCFIGFKVPPETCTFTHVTHVLIDIIEGHRFFNCSKANDMMSGLHSSIDPFVEALSGTCRIIIQNGSARP